MRSEFGANAEWMICLNCPLLQSHYVITYLSFVFRTNLTWLLHCNAMNFDS
jgi:hypothetical protein